MSWDYRKLGTISKITKGKKPTTQFTEYREGAMRTIQIQDLRDDSKVNYTSDKSGVKIEPHEIGIAWDGANAGTIGVGTSGFIGSTIARISFDTSLADSNYLAHYLKTKFGYLNASTTGSTIPHVSKSALDSLEIPLPPLLIQHRIAAVLDEVDSLRQKRERSIKRLEALRREAYFEHSKIHSGVRVKLSDLINPRKGGMRTGPFGSQLLHSEFVDDVGGVMVLGIDNVVSNKFRYTGERYITKEKYNKLRRYTVYPKDILITIMGTCGRVAIVPDDIPTAINTKHICAISLNELCLPEYIYATFMYNTSVLKQMGASARGAIMDGLNMGIISSLEFNLPRIEEQKTVQDSMRLIEKVNEHAVQAKVNEEALMAVLQSRAFSGELALRDLEAVL